jgi:ketosteroid isomerase-like protein
VHRWQGAAQVPNAVELDPRRRARLGSLKPTRKIAQTDQKGDIVPERSPEIEQVLRGIMDGMGRSDVDEIARLTSHDACVLAIGSDASEWAEGHDDIMQLFRASTPEGEFGVRVGLDDVTAFREGSVGWAAGHGYFEMEGSRVQVRLTAVAHQEAGDWKAVQLHASIGVPNERMLDPMFQGTG